MMTDQPTLCHECASHGKVVVATHMAQAYVKRLGMLPVCEEHADEAKYYGRLVEKIKEKR